jgi:hypothetical protein
MKKGTRVARVSVRSNEGDIGERGIIRTVYMDHGEILGYQVEWDAIGELIPQRVAYVAPVRVVSLEDYLADEKNRKAVA